MELPCKKCTAKMLKSVAGVSWRAHPSCLILLYRGLYIGPGIWVGLFHEYGKNTYAGFRKGSVPV
jgi:hypothetical protein